LIKNNKNFALVFIDLDNFKNVNDFKGHTIGDETLKKVALYFKENLRGEDKVIRYGGDEFCLILHYADRERVKIVIDRLRLNFLRMKFLEGMDIGFSYGLALFPEDGDTLDKLLAKADEGMYKMKENDKRKM